VDDTHALVAFTGEIVEWRGPAPFLFVPVPDEHVAELRYAAREASYGWGCVPATARIGQSEFTTSLFPHGETYFLPVKVAVQRAEQVGLGDRVTTVIAIRPR
jgi:hypothetical protein